MQSIKKELLILVIGFLALTLIAFFMYFSLRIVHKKSYQIVKNELKIEAKTTTKNLYVFLNQNKNMLNKTFLNLSQNKETIKYYLNNYISIAEKRYIKSIYMVKNNNTVIFLYPYMSNKPIPISMFKNADMLLKNIDKAKLKMEPLYFNSSILDKHFQTKPAVMLIKPFINSRFYFGSLVEIIDIQKKLDDIFSYLKDYSANITLHKIRKGEYKKVTTIQAPFYLDNIKFYINLTHTCNAKKTILTNLRDVMLNLLFMIIIIFVLFISVSIILIKKSHKETLHKHILSKLNKRIKMLEDTMSIQQEYLSTNFVKKILKMANNVFDANLSGIFLKSTYINYTFDGKDFKEQDYISIKNSLSHYAWRNKKDIIINDYQNADFISNNVKRQTKVKSSICAIISFKNHDYGVICIGSTQTKNAFSIEDFNFLKLIAHNIALNTHRSILSKDIAETLLNAIEARDSYTEGHSRRVGEYARFISNVIGFDEEFQQNILTAGLFHDVGKVGIPDIILLKPTKLSPNEYEIMKLHAVFSYEILKNLEILKPVIDGIRGHHERWDGKGYPDGLSEEDIPITGRILAIADSFDAITTLRPYKSAMTLEQTKQELINNAGTQFDPDIIEKILPYLEDMYNLGKNLSKHKRLLFPKFVENARKNIFYTDWFTGLMTMEYFEITMNNIITKGVDFFVCRIDVVNFSEIKYKLGRKKASEIILIITTTLKNYIGYEIARTSEDVFTFIVRGKKDPTTLLEEIVKNIETKTGYNIRWSYVSYPSDGKSVDELIYNLDIKHKHAGYKKY